MNDFKSSLKILNGHNREELLQIYAKLYDIEKILYSFNGLNASEKEEKAKSTPEYQDALKKRNETNIKPQIMEIREYLSLLSQKPWVKYANQEAVHMYKSLSDKLRNIY